MTRAPRLVIGVGNPSRGDDALGPRFVERVGAALVAEIARGEIELLTDFQLQIEHTLDLEGRDEVTFVDASVTAAPPFEHTRTEALADGTASTHVMSPAALLDACRAVGVSSPTAWTLAIRGERFELGEDLSDHARAHLDAAVGFFVGHVRRGSDARGGRRWDIEGIVQGVGFRPWIARTAHALGLSGGVRNTRRGVTIEAFGEPQALDALTKAFTTDAPAAACVRSVHTTTLVGTARNDGFVIGPSDADGSGGMTLPPDLATCEACLRDVDDARDRHHRYAFTSCTACGPRYAIARALPYDRDTTTMAVFTPCAACRGEYDDAADRRFHAQTLACAVCGPRVWLADARGVALATEDPIAAAVARLGRGEIVGVQGLGAFHLVCDATSETAVAELRRRKRRDAQPFAVLVHDMPAAEAIAVLDEEARAHLQSPAHPIVLAPSRGAVLAPGVNGPSRRTGVMLPYSPLHHLLARGVARPLVVTSGNASGAPTVIAHDEAFAALGNLVDAFLLHDRPIARRVEDSVVSDGRVVRRARGFAPSPIRLPVAAPEPVLAVGGHMKSTACLVVGDLAYLTPHLGDLGLVASEAAFRRETCGLESLLGVRADVLAHDLHPDYASTRYALARSARRRIAVQHHVAHVQAALAEIHVGEPVVGVVLDGSGFGPDGTSWGAEVLVVDGAEWTRARTFRPLALAGGERAIREVWRLALAALVDAFGADEARSLALRLPAFARIEPALRDGVMRMLATETGTVRARGMGRFFDAAGALALGIDRADFDGHVAIAFDEAADEAEVASYAAASDAEIDLRPTMRAVALDAAAGVAPSVIAARFHATIAAVVTAAVGEVLAETGLRRVVLTGGCLQSPRLARSLKDRLGPDRVVMPRAVPVNDGGLALGQAYAAVLALAAERA